MRTAVFICLLIAPLLAAAQPDTVKPTPSPRLDPAQIDLGALIECRGNLEKFRYLGPARVDPLQAVALGWRPLPQANLFMTEYALVRPISVFGQVTPHIAFTADSVIAVLDLPDPRPLAQQLALETAIDTADKAMFGKELVSEETLDPVSGTAYIRSVVLNVSNVASHPGKTLVGCSYSLDLAEDPEAAVDTGTAPGLEASPR